MKPFDDYPNGGVVPLGRLIASRDTDVCDLAHVLLRKTGQSSCAYCGTSLTGQYCRAVPAIDRAVPLSEAIRLGVPLELAEDIFNTVLCCQKCSRQGAGYKIPDEIKPRGTSRGMFIDLRDAVFRERRELMAARDSLEKKMYRRTARAARRFFTTNWLLKLVTAVISRLRGPKVDEHEDRAA